MNVTVNRAELLAAARRAAAVAPTDPPLDVLKGALLETGAGSGKLTVTATNLEVSLEQKVSCDTAEDDAIAVNAHLLEGMLEKLPGDRVELRRIPGRPELTLRSGDAVYEVTVWERGAFPRIEMPFPEDTVQVTGIPSMARRTVFATVNDSKKPLLKCVNLMFTQNGLKAAGSNGVCVVTAKGDEKSTGNVSLLLPAASLDKLAGMCGDEDVFRVGTTGQSIVFLKDDFIYSARLMEGSYIDTEGLTGMIHNQFTVLTDTQELRRALNAVRSVAPDGKVRLAFFGQNLSLRCQGEIGTAENSIEVVPLTGTAQGEYWYAERQLLAGLKALSGTLTLGVAQGGMLTLSTEDAYYMQTAMRPSAEKTPEKPAAKKPTEKPKEKKTTKKKPPAGKKSEKQAA